MDRTGEFERQIGVRPQLAARRARLLQLVQGLAGDDRGRLTAPAPWLARDLAAHTLGDDLNRLSRGRDTHSGPGPRPGETLPDLLHPIDDECVRARRSPEPRGGRHDAQCHDTRGPASRDYPEHGIHQEQIREATGRHR